MFFNQVINTAKKSAPYELKLNQGFNPGCQITVTGTSKPGVERFHINLCTDRDIALHFNPRYHQRQVVRNTKRNGRWESEERDGVMPMQLSLHFMITIVCENDGYKVSINRSHFTFFKHRISPGLVNRLETSDTVSLDQIAYQTSLAEISMGESSGYRFELQHGFGSGSELIITGMAHAYQKRFSIDFESSLPGQSVDKIFTFSPSFREGIIESNSFVRGIWGLKERHGSLPFRMGVSFRLLIRCEPDGFKMYVDENLFAFFKHRHPNLPVTHVGVTGNLIINEVNYHTQMEHRRLKDSEDGEPVFKMSGGSSCYGEQGFKMSGGGSCYGEPGFSGSGGGSVYCEPDFKTNGAERWFGEADFKLSGGEKLYPEIEDSLLKGVSQLGRDWESDNTVLLTFPFIKVFDCTNDRSPYKLSLTEGFESGSQIKIVGSVPSRSDRFQVNILKGNGDIGFHFAPRFCEGAVIRNTKVKGQWQSEERQGGFPFTHEKQFTVNIHSEQDAYKVFVNDDLFTTFKRRIGGADTYLDIGDEVYISNVIYQSTVKNQGPNILLEKGFSVGNKLTIFGHIELNRDRFFIDLSSQGHLTDIPLHIQLRWRQSLAVLCAFTNGVWACEQVQRGVFLHPGASVRIAITNESDGFQVFINDSFLGFYRHRCCTREIKNLVLGGGFQLGMIEYCTKI